jgi:hypothetical protein
MDVQDLVAVLNLINVSSQRGVFRGEELSDVGILYSTIKAEVERLKQSELDNASELETESVSGEVLS